MSLLTSAPPVPLDLCRYVKALNRRAQAYEALEKAEEALLDYTTVCFLTQFGDEASRSAADRLLIVVGQKKAAELLKTRDPCLPARSTVHMHMGTYMDLEEELSVPALTKLISADKQNPLLRYRRAVAILLANASDAAFLECEKASKLFVEAGKANPSDATLRAQGVRNLSLLGSLYMLRGQFEAATKTFEEVLLLEPTDVATQAKQANLVADMGDIQRALDMSKALADKYPEHPLAVYQRGQMYAATQQSTLAIEDFKNCIELGQKYALGPNPTLQQQALRPSRAVLFAPRPSRRHRASVACSPSSTCYPALQIVRALRAVGPAVPRPAKGGQGHRNVQDRRQEVSERGLPAHVLRRNSAVDPEDSRGRTIL